MNQKESINFETMPVYVINLDRRRDRWDKFIQQSYVRKFRELERYSAFDGKNIDIDTETRISIKTRENIRKNFRRSHYEINTVGACGASFSHIGCWKKFLKTDEPYCMILEDDCAVNAFDFERIIKLYSKIIPSDFDIWLLGHHRVSTESKPYMKNSPWLRVERFTGAHCYILSRNAAEQLLKECYPIENHIEFYMCNASYIYSLNMYRYRELRVPQMVEFTGLNDSDTVAIATCPLCRLPDNPINSHVILPTAALVQAIVGISALAIVSLGYFKGKKFF
jgi:GR25 family glycosyltransferase involved in LPS biosynthesis